MRILTYVELFISKMYSLLQLSKNYLSAGDDEVSLPSPAVEGETTLNELQVNKHFERICSTASFRFSFIPCKTTCEIISTNVQAKKKC